MNDYENKLLKVIIEDDKFLKSIIDIIHPKIFNYNMNGYVMTLILEYYKKYKITPKYDILEIMVKEQREETIDEDGNKKIDMVTKMTLDHLNEIKEMMLRIDDFEYIKDAIRKRVQDKSITKVLNDYQNGKDVNLADELGGIVKITNPKNGYEVYHFSDYDEDETIREVIPTGFDFIDGVGGVARGEIGIMMASTGVGKSVFLSYLANNFTLQGLNVLHIYFEGGKSEYLRLHRVKLREMDKDEFKGIKNLKLVKMKSGQSSIMDIQDFIDELKKDEGFVPDVICLDYLDLVAATKVKKENWMAEINTSNELEEFCQKNNLVLWTAVQTNRSGMNNEVPDLNSGAGSVSKSQKASMVLGISRNNQQKEDNTASVIIRKNRHGRTPESINNKWNPETMEIVLNETQEIFL